jgi:HEAT repeat protein
MSHFDASASRDRAKNTSLNPQPSVENVQPPIGTISPQLLAHQAADGSRGAAWRLLHLIIDNDIDVIKAATSLDDDRLAHHLLEFIALGTWAGKSFVAPLSVRNAHAKMRLRTLFLPDSGMSPDRAMRVLLDDVHDDRPAMREAALYVLGMIGNQTVIPVLLEALDDPVQGVRLQAVRALGHSKDPSVVPILLHTLHTADEQLGSQIFAALLQLRSAAVLGLIAESKSNSAWIRWHCIRALGQIADDRALPILVHALADQDHAVAWVAAKELPNFGKEIIRPVLHLLITEEVSPWLVETASYVLKNQCLHHKELRQYLDVLLKEMHSVGFRLTTPNVARKVLDELEDSGLLASSQTERDREC